MPRGHHASTTRAAITINSNGSIAWTAGLKPVPACRRSARCCRPAVFLAQGQPELSFLDNLFEMAPDANDHIVKLIVPKTLRPLFLKQLRTQMNISRATLFPGLDGFPIAAPIDCGDRKTGGSRRPRCGTLRRSHTSLGQPSTSASS